MSKTNGRMTVGRSEPPEIVVADSTFELEIKDVAEIQGDKEITTEKLLLLDLSDATLFHH